jgi:cardiolipin synthase
MREKLLEWMDWFAADGLVLQLFSVAGFILALLLIARLMSEKRAPANTFAWLLGIILLPWVSVPLYLLFGGRKLRRVIRRKSRVLPVLPGAAAHPAASASEPIAHTIVSAGAAPPVAGNTIAFIANGQDAYAALEQQIRAARHTIHITTFILGRDDTGRRLVRLLAERARAGVKVRLLLDSLGSWLTGAGFTHRLRRAGGEIARFMPVLPFSSRGSANLRNHRKIAVFDHCTAIIGGHNLAREYMGPHHFRKRWQDFGAVIAGPAAALLNDVFIADWCFATEQSPETLRAEIPASAVVPRGPSELQIVASGPDVPGDPLYEGIVSMVQEAKESIWIVTPYFIPDDVLFRSLVVKARSGVAVNLIVPARSDHRITDFARRHYLRELRRAGARVLLYTAGMLHSKALIVDDDVGLIGSANFDSRSLFVNFEIGVVVHTAADAQAMTAWARDLATHCREASSDPERRRSFGSNLLEDLSRLLAPLL